MGWVHSDDGQDERHCRWSFGAVIEGKGGAMAQVTSAHGGTHSYKIEEKHTFS